MKPQVPDELISAYFDGELSPVERAEVERLLSGNDDARRELNETAQLSALLHSFPRETAPVELAANVLRQTNLIPLPPLPSPTKTLTQNVWRDWKAGFAGAAITAAAMCLVIVLNTNHSHEQARSPVSTGFHVEMASIPVSPDAATPAVSMVTTADHAMLSRESDGAFKAGSDEDTNKERELVADAKQAAPVPAPTAMSAGRRARSELNQSGSPAVATTDATSTARTLQAAPADGTASALNELGQSNDEFVKGLREGKVYVVAPQPADPDSNVAVVYFEVVDIDRSADKLQVLLKKNSIEPRSVNSDAQPMPDDLVMMYVVAPGDQLAKTLKDVDQHRDLISNWTAKAPLQVAVTSEEAAPAVEQKTLAARGAPVDKSKKAEEPKASSEPEADMPEVQRVVEAYSQRNGLANTSVSNSINSNGQFGGGRGGGELQGQQTVSSSASEKKADFSQHARTSIANQSQPNPLTRSEPGYDYIRMNNSLAVNNTAIPNQSVTSQLNPLRAEPRSQASVSNSKKVASNDANSRALRMLFVLHPQSAGMPGQAAPAPAKAP